jgi:hypothetical protein
MGWQQIKFYSYSASLPDFLMQRTIKIVAAPSTEPASTTGMHMMVQPSNCSARPHVVFVLDGIAGAGVTGSCVRLPEAGVGL